MTGRDALQVVDLLLARVRGAFYSRFGPADFRRVGRNFKYYGHGRVVGDSIGVGDNCWFEAVTQYKDSLYSPEIVIGRGTNFSDSVHLSAVQKIIIGEDCLFGSNVYVGDHSHGSGRITSREALVPPASRELKDAEPIHIGARVWIGDGVVILAGSRIPDGSIVGANSVVKAVFEESGIMVGAPARMVRRID